MKQIIKFLATTATLSLMAVSANADIVLFDWGINIDGTSTCSGFVDPLDPALCTVDNAVPGDLPGTVDTSAFDFFDGLGTITVDVTGAGAHSVLAFFDHEIDEAINTYFNEYGTGDNVPAPGLTAEIGNPFLDDDENIYFHFLDNLLCNCTNVTAGSLDDVSMAMGWDFVLGAGEMAVVSFILSDTLFANPEEPGSPFYMTHADMDSPDKVYFWGGVEITDTEVPEPGTLMLFSLGLIGFGMAKKRQAAA